MRAAALAISLIAAATPAFAQERPPAERQTLLNEVQNYLLDIEPGFDPDPVRGVYNHGWLLGDESAIAGAVQARIDTLLEIQPVQTKGD